MGPIDVVAIVILIVAILVLVYYYLQNNPASVQKLRNYVPATADPHMGEILQNDSDYDDLSREKDTVEESKEESMSKRIKIKLSDIDMSGLNTDAFSNKRFLISSVKGGISISSFAKSPPFTYGKTASCGLSSFK